MSETMTPGAAGSFEARMVAWLNARFARPGMPRIEADSPLFAGRLIDSIRILELIAWTERAIGHEIRDVEIRMDNFRSVARIAEVFAKGAVRHPDHATIVLRDWHRVLMNTEHQAAAMQHVAFLD